MGTITESSQWEDSIYLLETNDLIAGGVDGVDNKPHWQLANRTVYLNDQITSLDAKFTEELNNLDLKIKDNIQVEINNIHVDLDDVKNEIGTGLRAYIAEGDNELAAQIQTLRVRSSVNSARVSALENKHNQIFDSSGKIVIEALPDIIQHNKGSFPNEESFPYTGTTGDYAINIETNTVWIWDSTVNKWVDSGDNSAVTKVNGKTGDVVINIDDIDNLRTLLESYQTNITNNNTTLVTNTNNTAVNTKNIATNTKNIATNAKNIAANTAAINSLKTTVTQPVITCTSSNNYYDRINLGIQTTTDSDSVTRVYYPFYNIKKGNVYGHGFMAQSAGAMVIASGEAGQRITTNSVPATGETEQLYLASDNNVYVYVGQNDAYDATKRVLFSSNSASYFPGHIWVRNRGIVKGTLPKANTYISLNFTGGTAESSTTASRLGCIETKVSTAGDVSTYIAAYKYTAGATTCTTMGLRYANSGTVTTFAPSPAATSDTNNIATTAWVRDRLIVSTANPSGGNNGDFWFKIK